MPSQPATRLSLVHLFWIASHRAVTNTSRRSAVPILLKLLARNLLVWTGKRTTFYGLTRTSKLYQPDLEQLFALLRSSRISVPIKATLRLDQIQQAHREDTSSAGTGSIILKIS